MFLQVNLDEEWTIPEENVFSKSKWTPFAGRKVVGKLKRVVLRGQLAYVDGQVLVSPGFGQDMRSWNKDLAPSSSPSLMVKKNPISVQIPEEVPIPSVAAKIRTRTDSMSLRNGGDVRVKYLSLIHI